MLDQLIAEVTNVRSELTKSVGSVPEELITRRPSEDEWSIGEVLAHLAIVEQGIGRLLNRLLERGMAEETTAIDAATVIDGATLPPLPSDRIVASEGATPTRQYTRAEALEMLEASRADLLDVARRSASYDLRTATFPHRILGDLNFYQWITFTGSHERRHLAQIERIKESMGDRA